MTTESDHDYVKYLSTLLTLAPPFPLPAEVRGGLGEIQRHKEVETWFGSKSSSSIYFSGRPETDRSLFSGTLFRWLQCLKSRHSQVAYYSFSGEDNRQRTSTSLLSSLVYQILIQDPARFWNVRDLLVAIDKQSSWTPQALWTIFRSLIVNFGSETFYCVINDTHNCDSSWIPLLKNLSALKAKDIMPATLKISLIGQEPQDTKAFLNAIQEVQLDGHVFFTELLQSQRIQKIAELIAERPHLLEFKKMIDDAMNQCENLLQLSLNVYVLKDNSHELLSNRRSIESKLQSLPYKVSDLVSKNFQTLPEWARKALGWILHAQRPMRLSELAVAIALVDEKESIEVDDAERLLDLPAELESAFGPLVNVDNHEVRLSHEQVKHCFQKIVKDGQEPKEVYTGQEVHLQDKTQKQIPLVNDWDITCILLKCFRSKEFLSATKKALQKDNWEKPQGPIFDLMEYAVQFWPAHYRKAEHQSFHAKEMFDLLQHQDLVQVWSELNSRFGGPLAALDMCVTHPFYLGALLGFADVVDFYLKKLKQESGKSVTLEVHSLAFYLASWAGHLDVVTNLVNNNLDNTSESLLLALKSASSRGHEQIVELLIEKLPKPIRNLDPALLCRAAELGYQALVSIFITAGADVDATYEGSTPLQLAARNGHVSILYDLLSHQADPNSALANDSSKVIQLAASKGYTDVVEHLLKFHAEVCVMDNDERTALHLASRNGHQQIVKLLLEQSPHVLAQDSNGQTALHLASFNGHTEIVKLLTQGKHDSKIDIQDTLGDTPLNLASKNGHLSVVELLLNKRAKLDVTDNEEERGHTALYHATSNGHEAIAERILQAMTEESQIKDVIEVLLEAAKRGFDVVCRLCIHMIPDTDLDLKDDNGYTALHYAAESGHVDTVSLLISQGARGDPGTNPISTPLVLAASAGRCQVVRILLAADADAMTRIDDCTLVSHVASGLSNTDGHADAVQALLDADVNPDDVDNKGRSALHHAAIHGNLKIAQVLLRGKADLTLQDDLLDWTPLHHAARNNQKEVVCLFINQDVDLFVSDSDGWTSMHIAAMWSHVPVMEVLWQAAPDLLNYMSNNGRTPLHFAEDAIRSTKWLLAHSIDVDTMSDAGETTLMMSAFSGQDTIVELLLSHNASVTLRDKRQQTALHYAAKLGHTKIAQKILEKDVSIINNQDNDGCTALHTAIYYESHHKTSEFTKVLIREGPHIDINLGDRKGNTPLMLAVREGLDDIVELLLENKAEVHLRNKKGETALLLATKDTVRTAWKTLLQNTKHLNINQGGGVFPTALHKAAELGELETVQQLLECDADVNAQGGLYNTALQAAAASGFKDIVDYLLREGADASLGGGLFANALSAAVAWGTFDIVPMLHERNADINAKDGQGRTAVHLAAWRGSLDNFQWLKDNQGDLNIQDHQGRTVVHHAAMAGSVDVMKLLMQDEKWKSLNVKDIDGWTPLHWACRSSGNEGMVTMLNDVEKHFPRETKSGWIPESIAVFHHADELLPLLALAVEKPADDEDLDILEGENLRRLTQLSRKSWKSGLSHDSHTCDGCQQHVSLSLEILI